MKPYYGPHNGITIYHGDCREILPSMERADVCFMDPPYGVGQQYGEKYSDDDRRRYESWIAASLPSLLGCASEVWVTPGNGNWFLWPPPSWTVCWAKPGSTRRNRTGGFGEWEPVLFYGSAKIQNDLILLPDCANHASDSGDHPCPKPLRLLTALLSVREWPLVIDPFMGSGTTLRAAKDLGRRAIGIEIEERYCEIAAKRMAQEVLPL